MPARRDLAVVAAADQIRTRFTLFTYRQHAIAAADRALAAHRAANPVALDDTGGATAIARDLVAVVAAFVCLNRCVTANRVEDTRARLRTRVLRVDGLAVGSATIAVD
jgi:hypothetical protein